MLGETPDLLVGCTGGGSNFGGLAFPFLRQAAGRGCDVRVAAPDKEPLLQSEHVCGKTSQQPCPLACRPTVSQHATRTS